MAGFRDNIDEIGTGGTVVDQDQLITVSGAIGSDGTILKSKGISSVTKGSTGYYTINFSEDFDDTNYTVTATAESTAAVVSVETANRAVGSIGVIVYKASTSSYLDVRFNIIITN